MQYLLPNHPGSAAAMVALLVLSVLAAPQASAELPSFERVRILDTPRIIGDAELTDQDGRPFRLDALKGRVAFVLFGFTSCPDVCPAAMSRLRELSTSGGLNPDEAAYVLISVDGARDTPEALRTFLARYSPDIIGLTGESALVKPIARQFSASFFRTGPEGNSTDYSVSHSPQIFVVDPVGRLRAEAYSASVEAMTGLARALLGEMEPSAQP